MSVEKEGYTSGAPEVNRWAVEVEEAVKEASAAGTNVDDAWVEALAAKLYDELPEKGDPIWDAPHKGKPFSELTEDEKDPYLMDIKRMTKEAGTKGL